MANRIVGATGCLSASAFLITLAAEPTVAHNIESIAECYVHACVSLSFAHNEPMDKHITIPDDAWCLRCGYLLRGLPSAVCPECGLTFDPDDASTYDTRSPQQRKARKTKIIIVSLSILFLAALFFPRGIATSSITFTCLDCSESDTIKRWQLKNPSWMPLSYPGIHWPWKNTLFSSNEKCDHSMYKIKAVKGKPGQPFYSYGTATPSTKNHIPFVNDFEATLQNVPDILKSFLNNKGFVVGVQPIKQNVDDNSPP